MSFNFHLFRRRRSPVIRGPLSSLVIVVRPPCVVALSAACSPRVVGYQPLAQQPPTSSRRPPPPPALFSRSSRRPMPALATANRPCRPTAPILALLHPPPTLLLVVSRPRPAPIVVVGAREGRGGCRRRAPCSEDRINESPFDDDGMPSSSASARGGRWCRPSSSPLAPTSFLLSPTRRRHRPPPSSGRRLQ